MKRTRKSLLTIIAVLAFLSSYGMMSYAEDETCFVGGTSVNGVKISDMTPEEAAQSLADYYSGSYQLALITKEGTKEYITASSIGYQVSLGGDLGSILAQQNEAGRITGPAAQSVYTFPVTGTFDREKLAEQIEALSCVSGPDVTITRDARISEYQEGQAFTVLPEEFGNNLDLEKLIPAVEQALSTGETELDLTAAGCYHKVKVRADNEQLNNLCKQLNAYKDMKITYAFSDEIKEELTGAVFTPWLSLSEDGGIAVRQEEAAAYIKGLAERYDTAGKTRIFRTIAGNETELTGPYGWALDQAAETAALTELILSGKSQVREPQFIKTAAVYSDQDWGTTYVEIDLTGQHVYLIQDGVLVWEAPCVTGNVSKNYTTPPGIYSLTYKEQDRILRGKKREDGSYEYESHVNYWMPFNGGIGLHDADWRGSFGGTIYQTNGSHGCVNLPPAQVPALYGLVYQGMPVICYN